MLRQLALVGLAVFFAPVSGTLLRGAGSDFIPASLNETQSGDVVVTINPKFMREFNVDIDMNTAQITDIDLKQVTRLSNKIRQPGGQTLGNMEDLIAALEKLMERLEDGDEPPSPSSDAVQNAHEDARIAHAAALEKMHHGPAGPPPHEFAGPQFSQLHQSLAEVQERIQEFGAEIQEKLDDIQMPELHAVTFPELGPFPGDMTFPELGAGPLVDMQLPERGDGPLVGIYFGGEAPFV
eukprot:GHVO01067108.1.p1 GENE.GHVO01067108.1~~GHVO01067108.1.p1  ORF type:complete len:247 (+),score=34.19 GHVO01067108.1:29-742(+)